MWLYLSSIDATLVDKVQVSGEELYYYGNNLVTHLEIGGLGCYGILCPLVLCKECHAVGWDVEPHNCAENIVSADAAVNHPVGPAVVYFPVEAPVHFIPVHCRVYLALGLARNALPSRDDNLLRLGVVLEIVWKRKHFCIFRFW